MSNTVSTLESPRILLQDSANKNHSREAALELGTQQYNAQSVVNNDTRRHQLKRNSIGRVSTSNNNDVVKFSSTINSDIKVNNSTRDSDPFVLEAENTPSGINVVPEQRNSRNKSTIRNINAFMPKSSSLSASFEQLLMQTTANVLKNLKQEFLVNNHKTVLPASVEKKDPVKVVDAQSKQPVIDMTMLQESEVNNSEHCNIVKNSFKKSKKARLSSIIGRLQPNTENDKECCSSMSMSSLRNQNMKQQEDHQNVSSATVSSTSSTNKAKSSECKNTVHSVRTSKEETAPDPVPLPNIEPVIEQVRQSVRKPCRKRKAVTVSSKSVSTVALKAIQSTSNDETVNSIKNNNNQFDTEIENESYDGNNENTIRRSSQEIRPDSLEPETDDIPDGFKHIKDGIYQSDIALTISDNQFFGTVPARMSSLSKIKKYECTVGEIRRRVLGPEAFNFSMLNALLRRAKVPKSNQLLTKELHEIGLYLPHRRRCAEKISSMSFLTEQEAAQFAIDFEKLTKKYFPVKVLAEATIEAVEYSERISTRLNELKSTLNIIDEFRNWLSFDRGKVCNEYENAVLMSEIQDAFNIYSQHTHGYGNLALFVSINVFHEFINKQIELVKYTTHNNS